MFKLILTVDYELFGNGSGCVDACLIEPTNRFLELLEKFNCRATFFVDALELLAFKLDDGENYINSIEEQIKDIARKGHEIQLHIHPQWIGAQKDIDGNWLLDYNLWRLPSVKKNSYSYGGQNGISGVIANCIDYLENLIHQVDSTYKCTAFRAGSWCIQPELEVLEALKDNGVYIDSTVAPGMYFDNGLTKYDFRSASMSKPYWNVDKDLCKESHLNQFTEIPIHTAKTNIFNRIYWKMLKKVQSINSLPDGCKGSPASISMNLDQRYTKKSKDIKMFDFCNSSFSELKYMIKSAEKQKEALKTDENIPIVAIGHSKNFANEKQLFNLLKWIEMQEKIGFDQIGEESWWQRKF